MTEPLAAFVARALRTDVQGVTIEPLAASADGVEHERIRYAVDGAPATLVFERLPPGRVLAAQLEPFLARKSDRVRSVRARGIPPNAPPWVLVEDLVDAPSACGRDPSEIVRAKAAVERAVAADGPALRALGVPARTPAAIATELGDARAAAAAEKLASWPSALVHGDLTCAHAVIATRGVVLTGWGRAYLGCALLDVARLATDVGDDAALWKAYADATARELSLAEIDAARTLEGLARAASAL